MITVVGFVMAAAAGALGRTEVARRWNRVDLPLGTLMVNVSGSFAVGLLADVAPPLLTVVTAGALGTYTTFSSFARDAVALIERRRHALAAAYVAATLVLGVAAAALGMRLAGFPVS